MRRSEEQKTIESKKRFKIEKLEERIAPRGTPRSGARGAVNTEEYIRWRRGLR